MKCRLEVKIIPGSSCNEIVGWLHDCLKMKVTAPPEKGKANAAVIGLLSKKLNLNKHSIAIIKGSTSQRKIVELEGISPQQLSAALPPKAT